MPNNYFSFKQFTIQQEHCAMKVCTDACILGAWAAKKTALNSAEELSILDIGTGTGLLSLMLAQQLPAMIHAVELDKAAAMQAKENVAASPWPQKIKLYQQNIMCFEPANKFDVIISNPPFYEHELKSPSLEKNAAKHDTALKLSELINCIGQMLADEGQAFILLPQHRTARLIELAKENNLFINQMLLVKQSPAHDFFRSVFMLSKSAGATITSELMIHDSQRQYTASFKELLQEYYLQF